MPKSLLVILSVFLCVLSASAQQRMDGRIKNVKGKKQGYAIYIPSTYNDAFLNPAVIAIHPQNFKWDYLKWRERLTRFSEKNGIILICPEQTYLSHDPAHVSTLLDSVNKWLEIDPYRVYALGNFNFDSSTRKRLKGVISLGFNEQDAEGINGRIKNQKNMAYVILSSLDKYRFQPVVSDLVDFKFIRGASVNMSFQYRDRTLSEALTWLELKNILPKQPLISKSETKELTTEPSISRGNGRATIPNFSATIDEVEMTSVKWYGQLYFTGEIIPVRTDHEILSVLVYNNLGKLFRVYDDSLSKVRTSGWRKGSYIMKVNTTAGMETHVLKLN